MACLGSPCICSPVPDKETRTVLTSSPQAVGWISRLAVQLPIALRIKALRTSPPTAFEQHGCCGRRRGP